MASQLNYDLFRNVVAPEFSSKTDSELDTFANEAELELSESFWGKLYPRALALITAHLIKISTLNSGNGAPAGATGQITKVKVGDLERQYHVSDSGGDSGNYDLTFYGKEFLRLKKKMVRSPIPVTYKNLGV